MLAAMNHREAPRARLPTGWAGPDRGAHRARRTPDRRSGAGPAAEMSGAAVPADPGIVRRQQRFGRSLVDRGAHVTAAQAGGRSSDLVPRSRPPFEPDRTYLQGLDGVGLDTPLARATALPEEGPVTVFMLTAGTRKETGSGQVRLQGGMNTWTKYGYEDRTKVCVVYWPARSVARRVIIEDWDWEDRSVLDAQSGPAKNVLTQCTERLPKGAQDRQRAAQP